MQLYNTKSRKLEEFKPISDKTVLLYTCGPTVYNYLQIGNWVAYIRWDTLVRTLQANGYTVNRFMNITDVGHLVSDADEGQDKLEKGAQREGKTAWEVAQFYADDFLAGMNKLNLLPPKNIGRATDYISEQIELVKTLETRGYTYIIDDGVYFDTSKFASYADFAKLNLAELQKGARVAYNSQKRNASDFALWKFSPAGEKRDMEWSSPWGVGFPGWHLECSAMALTQLANTIDIHTGGIDHIPVHHTNEIAQSEAATGQTFANYWVHNNFLLCDGTKASKSLGNTYTLQDLETKGYDPADFKMFVLQSHYRSESNFTWDNLSAAKNRLENWRNIACLAWQVDDTSIEPDEDCVSDESLAYLHASQGILLALNNDLDTPTALVAAEEGLNYANTHGVSLASLASFKQLLQQIHDLLGLNIESADITAEQKDILLAREKARTPKNWQLSDELRDRLAKQGIGINDSAHGQRWHRT